MVWKAATKEEDAVAVEGVEEGSEYSSEVGEGWSEMLIGKRERGLWG